MYTYNSHRISPNRAFDFLYDPNFKVHGRNSKKLEFKSIMKMSPVHLIPSYLNMFSDTKPRSYIFHQKNPLPSEINKSCLKYSQNKPLNKSNFCVNNIHTKTCKDIFFRSKNRVETWKKSKRNVKCQTLYRENDCQTSIWEPEPRLAKHVKTVPEILYVKCENEPDEREVMKIERNRVRREWEENLTRISYNEISFEERKEQMRLFEMENYLLKEKEFNEKQEMRMEYICDIIDKREKQNEEIMEERLKRILDKSMALKNEKHKKNKKKYERNILAYAKHVGFAKHDNQLDSSSFIENKMYVPYTSITLNSQNRSYQNLSISKISSKRATKFSVKELEDYINYICSKRNEKTSEIRPKCLKEKVPNINDSLEETIPSGNNFDEIYQNHILVQKVIKGVVVRNELFTNMNSKISNIEKLQKEFPIRCVTELLSLEIDDIIIEPDIKTKKKEGDKIISLHHESKESIVIQKLQIEDVAKIMGEILENSCRLADEESNRKLLKMAQFEREKRQKLAKIKEIQGQIVKVKREVVRESVEKMYDGIVAELMSKILPVAIEIIAEKEAVEFIFQKTENISEKSFENCLDNIDEFLNEIMISLIRSDFSKYDEQLIGLLGSYDAFESFINDNFTLKILNSSMPE